MRTVSERSLVSMAYPGLVAGLLLFVALVVRQGVGEVASAVAIAGSGLLVVALFHLVSMLAHALGWRVLVAQGQPLIGTMLFGRWIGESVNGLLPVLQIGGNVVKAQVVAARGIDVPTAGSTVVVDVMMMVSTQVAFTLLGTALLVVVVGMLVVVVMLVGSQTRRS